MKSSAPHQVTNFHCQSRWVVDLFIGEVKRGHAEFLPEEFVLACNFSELVDESNIDDTPRTQSVSIVRECLNLLESGHFRSNISKTRVDTMVNRCVEFLDKYA